VLVVVENMIALALLDEKLWNWKTLVILEIKLHIYYVKTIFGLHMI
jgi:hypothetical protein